LHVESLPSFSKKLALVMSSYVPSGIMIKLFAIYLIIDSIASLVHYRKQSWWEQGIRIGRGLIGLLLASGRENGR